MDVVENARLALERGDPQGAVATLVAGGEAGDARCWTQLGFWNLQGRVIPRDLARSRECFEKAAKLGDRRGGAVYISLLANGTGGPADFLEALNLLREKAGSDPAAATQLRLLDSMHLSERGDPLDVPEGRRISSAPQVSLFPGLFTKAECQYLMDFANPAYRPAVVGDLATGRQSQSEVRTCDVAGFPWVAENPAIHALNRRIAAASGLAAECGEPLQLLRYRPGQEFKPHRDCTEATDNQRVLTMLVYLNEEYTGGETHFLKTGLKIKGRTGDGLLFRNADELGRPDPDSTHAGLPVLSGEKIIASRWIRQKPFGPRVNTGSGPA